MKYYVYQYIDPNTSEPFYIGKGSGSRDEYHLTETADTTDNIRKFNYIRRLVDAGISPRIERIKYFESETDAYDYETELISTYGRQGIDSGGVLMNITLGPAPPSRKGKKVVFTEEHRANLSKALKGVKRQSSWSKGLTKHTDPRVARMAENRASAGNDHQIGRVLTEETRTKIRGALTGRVVPQDQRDKMSKSRRGRTWEDLYGIEGAAKRRSAKAVRPGPNSKPVMTPYGVFPSVSAAAAFCSVHEATIRAWCLDDRKPNWYYATGD